MTPIFGAKVLVMVVLGVPFMIWWAKTGSRIRPGGTRDVLFVIAWACVPPAAFAVWSLWAMGGWR